MLFSLCLAGYCTYAPAQDTPSNNFFTPANTASIKQIKPMIQARHFQIMHLDQKSLKKSLSKAPKKGVNTQSSVTITLPLPNNTFETYEVFQNSTLHPKLKAKFPEINTYDAYSVNNPGEWVKLDLTHQGFHAMILRAGKSPVFIDPVSKENHSYYIVYYKKDFISPQKLKCEVNQQNPSLSLSGFGNTLAPYYPCQLKKYRLAMAATAQYTQFHGGTVAGALSAETTTMNRVNGIYETDMAITMQLIANNDLIIYTNPNNQPYTHGDPDKLILENQANVDAVIGSANYDIGHVVDAAGSGLARLRSVCIAGLKARGVTGKTTPVSDPFDVDYVAHEMGHQFGATHTQNNNCNRYDPTAVEPGSGSTIMGYAGICAPNVQGNSDAYFHGISLEQMGEFVASPQHNCPVTTPIPEAPVIKYTNGDRSIPMSTPFTLTANAAPSSGSGVLTYTWEQMNNEITPQPPVATATGGPNFRSFTPKTTNTRYLPNLNALSNGGPFTWEVLPAVSRILKFRVSVRSNAPGGSCNTYRDTQVAVTPTAGPFLVTYPTDAGVTWSGLSAQQVTWNVANTQFPPLNTEHVNLYLSIDGGQNYSIPLLLNAPNTGNAEVCVPNVNSATARVQVQASTGGFFNISQNNFVINAVPIQSPVLGLATRNHMNNQEAFILYTNCLPTTGATYHINGIPGATVTLDVRNKRFIVGNIHTPRKVVNVTITVTDSNQVSKTSNPVTIPGIL